MPEQSSDDAPQSVLAVTLALTIAGTAYAIPCSQVKRIALDLHSYGFEAEVEFYTSPHRGEDTLFAAFTTPGLVEVGLTIANERALVAPAPIVVSGIVTHKEFVEQTGEAALTGQPVMHRRYTLRFADPARVLWGQHYPCELHVDLALTAVIDAQKGAKVTITYDWAAELDGVRPMTFLPLGTSANAASFYDFVCWFTATRNGVLTYDAATSAYKLSAAKAAPGTAVPLPFVEVGAVRLELPETPRASAVVLNSSIAIAAKKEATANANGVAKVRRDFLVRMPAQADVDARATLEGLRLATRGHEAVVTFALFPTVSVLPGAIVNFSQARFGAATFTSAKDYRVRELVVRARSADPGPVAEDTVATAFVTEVTARLELATETWATLPPYRAPRWPARVEGLIVSEVGEEADETWQAYTDSVTSLDRYKVKVPLYKKDGADVFVFPPFDPNGLPGHLFFPAYKGERVLLAFELFSVTVEKFLDWRAGGRLPADGQGNHMLVGKKATSQTSVKHDYVEAKPVLLVSRLSDKDTQIIELKDGTITIRTKENA